MSDRTHVQSYEYGVYEGGDAKADAHAHADRIGGHVVQISCRPGGVCGDSGNGQTHVVYTGPKKN